MKKVVITLAACTAFAGSCFAGTETVSSGKTHKEYKAEEPASTCFADTELQLDTFGAYVDGNSPNHAGPIRDHAWGGGIGVNYFFARYFGLGVDGYWVAAKSNLAAGASEDTTTFHNGSGSFIVRYPIDSLCLAPYAFIGGGVHVDGDQFASGHAGVGVEYRVVPNKIGIFSDARWNYFGTRYGHDDQNNFLVKAGFRVIF